MIKQRYISSLLNLNNKQITEGIRQLNLKYNDNISFKDRLNCIMFKKN